MYDVAIIGAGIVGCAIARELSKYKLKTCLLEQCDDVSVGTTKANSGIVHGGYAEKPGSIKAKFSYSGNKLYHQLSKDLNFAFEQTGSFVIGFDEQDKIKIQELFESGGKNGIPNLQIVDGEFVRKKEPNLNEAITTALYCPHAGITSPYDIAIALAENAITNGVEINLNTKIISIKKKDKNFIIKTNNKQFSSKIIINAAGLYSDEIARMVGIENFSIKPRQGQYLLFDKDQGELVNSVIFQTPTKISKGILVTKTYHGNLLIGPDACDISNKNYLDTSASNLNLIIETAKKTISDFDLRKVITTFAGNRSASSTGDFIIEESNIVPGFINVAGIESPGLTAAPAIAIYVVQLISDTKLFVLSENAEFNPKREPYKNIAKMSKDELSKLIKQNPKYGNIVCRCETISEGEICDVLQRNIPINSIDAIKRRVRCGMGRCQGGFCGPKVIDIISLELNLPKTQITKTGGHSFILVGKTKQHL